MDATYLNATVTKHLEKEDLLLLLAFNVGFLPDEEPIEKPGSTFNNIYFYFVNLLRNKFLAQDFNFHHNNTNRGGRRPK